MRVEVALFSGRPNPSWELAAHEVAELATRLAQLTPQAPGHPLPDGLGFRGFMLTAGHGELEPWRDLVVYHSVISARGGHRVTEFRDDGLAVETALVAMARAHDPALGQLIELGMSAPGA